MNYFNKKILWMFMIMVISLPAGSSNSQPDVVWTVTYDSGSQDSAYDVVVDSSGNVYVTGGSYVSGGDNYYTIKYDSNGNELWNATYDGGSWDTPAGAAIDSDGNVYVTGMSYLNGNFDYYTIKYNSDGKELWNATYDSGSNDQARGGVAVDGNGNVYVTGESHFGGTPDYLTVKYDSNGNELWNVTYDGGSNHSSNGDVALGIAIGGSFIYVTGHSYLNDYDYTTIKYDSNGNELWNTTYNGVSHDIARGVAVDSNGNVYVTGDSFLSGDDNYYTIKYDSNGNELWNVTYDGGSSDVATGVVVDSNGSVYVAGYSYLNGDNDYYTIKYDSNGNKLWDANYDGGSNDNPAGVAVDSNGNVYVTGFSYLNGDNDYYTIKYSQTLTPQHNRIGYSALIATGQNTYVQSSNGAFGLLLKGQSKTINNSVILNNTGDISAKVEARFNDSIGGVFGLVSGANVLTATNFALGLPSSFVPLNNSGADVQVVVAPPGVTALDARLSVPNEQMAGDYQGTVVLTFSNNV